MAKPSLRIALWQCPPLPLDVAGSLARLDRQAALATEQGADLLVCPEMFLSGYNIGAAAANAHAETPDGPSAQAIAQIAREHGIALAYGYPERGAQQAIFNAAQLLGADGSTLGRYRKTHLFGGLDRSMFAPGNGDEALFDLHGWRLGLLICYDIEFPENARRLALAGADLIVVPTANMEGFDFAARTLVPARAFENQLFVAYANYCGGEGGLRYGGLSCLAAPDGEGLVQAGRGELLLLAELSRERLTASRALYPYLADRRPDID